VEDRSYSGSWLISSQAERNQSSRKALKEQYEMLLQSGIERLFYVDGESLLGNDRDDTTDGSHPSDLGFFRHAEALEPVLRKALG
jgi:lysophospholipase L1-like esterase